MRAQQYGVFIYSTGSVMGMYATSLDERLPVELRSVHRDITRMMVNVIGNYLKMVLWS